MKYVEPYREERPWGSFVRFTNNSLSTVKIITVRKGEAFSLQYHNKRTEFWKVLSGSPEITIGEYTIKAKKGEEFEISPKIKHRITSTDMDTDILEIATGEFDENDIIRLEDKYGRS